MMSTKLPSGIKLICTFRGHEARITQLTWSPNGTFLASCAFDSSIRVWNLQTGMQEKIFRPNDATHGTRDWWEIAGMSGIAWRPAWSPNNQMLASGYGDYFIRVWDFKSGDLGFILSGHKRKVNNVDWSPDGKTLASSSDDSTIRVWSIEERKQIMILGEHFEGVNSIRWSPNGEMLASGSLDGTVRIWDMKTFRNLLTLVGHSDIVTNVAWSPDGSKVVSSSGDRTVMIWDTKTGDQEIVLEGHTNAVSSVTFSFDGKLLASKSIEKDGTIRIWRTDTWNLAASLNEPSGSMWFAGLAFHPSLLLLASLTETDKKIRVWKLDYDSLVGKSVDSESAHYRNAKVVLLGDSGVGKSGLGLAITGRGFIPTESTHGRHVYTLDKKVVTCPDGSKETREILLWDVAGQPGYRLIHQLYLDEVTVAVIVFDARNEINPLSGVTHWCNALRQSQLRQGHSFTPFVKFLVSARNDRGGVPVSQERIENLLNEKGFSAYFETSAKEGWNIKELASAINQSIQWDSLPKVTSTSLFLAIKRFILSEKDSGRLLCTVDDLYRAFLLTHSDISDSTLRLKFDTCVTRLENRDLIRSLSFGNYILLQPEILDAYASALINAAIKEPEEMGSLAEEDALSGRFEMPQKTRLKDLSQEELLLIATIRELINYDLALRENADDGVYLVFPSQAIRDWPDAPDPEGKLLRIRFEGSVRNIYTTLAVRLSHSRSFSSNRSEMWHNAIVFNASVGGKCGVYLQEFDEGLGQLTLFFSPKAGSQTRLQFIDYVLAHIKRRAIPESIKEFYFFVCANCGEAVPERYAQGRLERGFSSIECAVCGSQVSLVNPRKQLADQFSSNVLEMDTAADEVRTRNSAHMTLLGKIESNDFDVFLCHNSIDKPSVREISSKLKIRGIYTWLDEEQLRPGIPWQRDLEQQIKNIKSVAVFIGESGIGPWQEMELESFLREFVRRRCPVIPVLLSTAPKEPQLPVFLNSMTWVDFRRKEPDPLKQLLWGITGKKNQEI